MSSRSLSVLVVNYNGAAFLPACLDALQRQTLPADRFDVIVLDNASTDGSAELATIRQTQNLGFAAGNNEAAQAARGEYLVLLNPDTTPDPHWLGELDRAIDENPGCAIACKLVLADDPSKLNSAGLFVLRDGRGADRGFGQVDDGRYESGGEVFGGCAAALALPNDGQPLFDPELFLYCEDLELAWRRQKQGLRTVYAPRAVVRHAVGAGDSPTYWYYSERNRAVVARRHGDFVMRATAGVGLFLRAVRGVLMATFRHPAAKYRWHNVRAVVRAWWDFLFNPRLRIR